MIIFYILFIFQGIFSDLIGHNRLGNNIFYKNINSASKSTFKDQLLRFLMEFPDKKIQLEARKKYHEIHFMPSKRAVKMYRSRFMLYAGNQFYCCSH